MLSNMTGDLAPRPAEANVITDETIFKHKVKANGSLDRYKARWVLQWFTQCLGMDFDETFSPVVMPTSIHTMLTLVLSQCWPMHQLDVKNVFFHGTL
jgi:hypothetical protein